MNKFKFAIDKEGDFCYDVYFNDKIYNSLMCKAICWDVWSSYKSVNEIVYTHEIYFDEVTAVITRSPIDDDAKEY